MASSRARVDASQVDRFADRLALASRLIEEEGEQFEEEWGKKLETEMRSDVPSGPGDPVHLRDEIEQVEPGGITMGQAYWWRFLEYGTSKMAPQPFIRPAIKRVKTPAKKDAGQRAVRLMQRGR